MFTFTTAALLLLIANVLLPFARALQIDNGPKVFFVSKEVMTWKEAAVFCVQSEFNDRYRFSTIRNDKDNNKATQALAEANKVTGEVLDGWLGGYRPNGNWVWGDLSSFAYKNWGGNQPHQGLNCLFMKIKEGEGVWGSADCAEKKRAVCEAFAYSKLYDFIKRDQLLNRTMALAACKDRGGSLGTVLSPPENIAINHHVNGGTRAPATLGPTSKATKKPTPKPSRLKCCPDIATRAKCCYLNSETPKPAVCNTCKCCCCKPNSSTFGRCCRNNDFVMCGCQHKPTTKKPTSSKPATPRPTRRTKAPTGKPTFKIPGRQLMDEDSEEEDVEEGSEYRRSTSSDVLVFLNAFNEKIQFVKEENASFVWGNGVSFKSIGYLPKELTKGYSNFATYPEQKLNYSCIVYNGLDGKWRNVPCNILANGALCEIRVTTKKFQAFTSNGKMKQSDAGDFCAAAGGQLASIKTEQERQAAIVALKAANSDCDGCLETAWTSGIKLTNFYWGDGFLFMKDGIFVGLKTGFANPGDDGLCVAISRNGVISRDNCEADFYPLCEFQGTKSEPLLPVIPSDKCYPGCLQSMRGDGVCDAVCNHNTCGYDNDDCGQCAPGCPYTKIKNGVCDPECFAASCAFDSQDCFGAPVVDPVGRLLADASPKETASENDATPARRLLELPPACSQTSQSCNPLWIGDKYCDIIACGRECDADDCKDVSSVLTCEDTCRDSDLYNDRCDKGCATLQCNYDGGLCPLSCDSACGLNITKNACTKPSCDVPMCRYDINRCRDPLNSALRCSPGCDSRVLGNGQCDAGCNNQACKWDAGDCPEQDFCPYPVPFDEYGCIDQCNNPLNKFQRGACENTCFVNGCKPEMLGNGVCDVACNTASCGMDGGDCAPCAAGCNPFELNNGICTASCNIAGKCGNDGGDCL